MSFSTSAPCKTIRVERSFARRQPRPILATWAPTGQSQESSFLPWEELISPRFPGPPRMPHDLEAPQVADLVFLDDDELNSWFLDS